AGSSCGNILISGGFISAIGGGSYGSAGIGAGGAVLSESSCGNIDILISVARVMAVQNKSFEGTTVGGYKGSTYGTVTVAGVVQDSIKDSIYIFETYTIALHANYGSDSVALQNMIIGTGVTKLMDSPFNREGYTLKNWTTESDGSGTAYSKNTALSNLSETAGDTVHLYAQWAANSYTVTFDENHEESGDGSMEDQNFTYDVAGNLNANEFIRFDYVFGNWNTAADGSGSVYADKASVKNLSATNKDTVVLYAQWLKPLSHSDMIVPFIDEQVYTGSAITPKILVYDGETLLTENVDYELTFANNVEPGTATVTLKGLGNYAGEVTISFEIVEETTTIRQKQSPRIRVKAGKRFDLIGRRR
nr:InlB B-repeat-containing protein [Fibrobacter sp.]